MKTPMVRSTSTTSSRSDVGDDTEALERRFGGESEDEEADNVLTALSINISPGKKGRTAGGGVKGAYHGGPSKRSGRHSVAADSGAGTGPMTLRDQEQVSRPSKSIRSGRKLKI